MMFPPAATWTRAVGLRGLINYISKYCSKEEKKSASYKELLNTVTLYINKLYAFSSIITKFINKLISKRNWLV